MHAFDMQNKRLLTYLLTYLNLLTYYYYYFHYVGFVTLCAGNLGTVSI